MNIGGAIAMMIVVDVILIVCVLGAVLAALTFGAWYIFGPIGICI